MACIYCKTENLKVEFEITDIFDDTYGFKKCKRCSTWYLDPQPSAIQLEQAYGRDYYGEGKSKFNPLTQKVFNQIKKWSILFFSKRLKKKDKVLDIGCGDGSFLEALNATVNIEMHGLEMEGESANRCARKKDIHLTVEAFKKDLFKPNSFDVVSLIHVFEHLPYPRNTILELNKIVKPNGLLFIEIPNINSLQFKLFKSNWFHLDPPRHLNMMDPKSLILELEKAGFECLESSYHSTQFGPFGFQQSLLNALGFKRDVLYEYLKRNHLYYQGYPRFVLYAMLLFHWLSFPLFAVSDIIVSFFGLGSTVRLAFRKSKLQS